MAETGDPSSAHVYPKSGWYSHTVMAKVLDNVIRPDTRMLSRRVSSGDYGYMLTTAAVRGAVVNESNVHWTAIVKHDNALWYVDSQVPPPERPLGMRSFVELVKQHNIFYIVDHACDIE